MYDPVLVMITFQSRILLQLWLRAQEMASGKTRINTIVYIYTHIYIYIYMYVYIRKYIWMYIYVNIHVYMYMYIYAYMYIYIHTHARTHDHRHIYIYGYVCIRIVFWTLKGTTGDSLRSKENLHDFGLIISGTVELVQMIFSSLTIDKQYKLLFIHIDDVAF